MLTLRFWFRDTGRNLKKIPFPNTCQKAGQVVWYSHLFKNFPEFVVIHKVKGFGIVNKADVDVFLELSCFCDYPTDVGQFALVSLPFLNPA